MELLQLNYFLELAETEHVNKTADNMMVTPSAVSISLAKLEKELGVQLFDRRGRNIVLNDKGRMFQKHIKDMFYSLEEAKKSVQADKYNSIIPLDICAVNPYLWNKPVEKYKTLWPSGSIKLSALDIGDGAKNPKNLLKDSHADLFIAAKDYFVNCDIESQHLADVPLYVAMSKKHKLARKKGIELEELKDEWFINSPHGTDFRRFCDELCLLSGFVPKSHIECDYMVRPNIIATQTDCVCICTMLGKESGLYRDTTLIPLKKPVALRSYIVAWNPKKPPTPQAMNFVEFLRAYYKEILK